MVSTSPSEVNKIVLGLFMRPFWELGVKIKISSISVTSFPPRTEKASNANSATELSGILLPLKNNKTN